MAMGSCEGPAPASSSSSLPSSSAPAARPPCPLQMLYAGLMAAEGTNAAGSSRDSRFLFKSALQPAANIWGRVVHFPKEVLISEIASSMGDEQSTAEGDLTEHETDSVVTKSILSDTGSLIDETEEDQSVENCASAAQDGESKVDSLLSRDVGCSVLSAEEPQHSPQTLHHGSNSLAQSVPHG